MQFHLAERIEFNVDWQVFAIRRAVRADREMPILIGAQSRAWHGFFEFPEMHFAVHGYSEFTISLVTQTSLSASNRKGRSCPSLATRTMSHGGTPKAQSCSLASEETCGTTCCRSGRAARPQCGQTASLKGTR